MMFELETSVGHIDQTGFMHLTRDPNGPIISDLRKRAYRIAALAKADAPKQTGRLAASISVQFVPGPNPSYTVGSNVSYAKDVHDGTRPHYIRPDKAKVLRFVHRGKIVYARETFHPGTRANPFLARHLRKVM